MRPQTQSIMDAAAQAFRDQLPQGATCPCCGRYGKLYKRRLNRGMAHMLLELFRARSRRDPDRFIDVRELKAFKAGSGDYAFLRFWGLVEQQPNTDEKKRSSGFWRITEKGCDFVRGKLNVPTHVFVFDNNPEGFSSEMTTFADALNHSFDYSELS